MVAVDKFLTWILKETIPRIEPGTFHRHGECSSTELYGVLQLLESVTCLLLSDGVTHSTPWKDTTYQSTLIYQRATLGRLVLLPQWIKMKVFQVLHYTSPGEWCGTIPEIDTDYIKGWSDGGSWQVLNIKFEGDDTGDHTWDLSQTWWMLSHWAIRCLSASRVCHLSTIEGRHHTFHSMEGRNISKHFNLPRGHTR